MAFGIPGLELSEKEKARFAAEDAARYASYGYNTYSTKDDEDDDSDLLEELATRLRLNRPDNSINTFRNCTKCALLGSGCRLQDSSKCGSFTPKRY